MGMIKALLTAVVIHMEFSTCHRRWQAKFNGDPTLGIGPVHEWDGRTCKSN